jgi:leader peptidase (prepilin peptidase)/N-methyltransferase
MTWLAVIVGAVFGACVGSFLGVVLWRVPRGESIVHPPSHCSECGHRLTPAELIPVVSYVVQQGRCRECGVEIPASALLVEIGCALLFGVIALVVAG